MAADRTRSNRAGTTTPRSAVNDAANEPTRRGRRRKLKPAPPVTDCVKCQTLATAREQLAAANLRIAALVREAEERELLDQARQIAGLRARPSDEAVDAALGAANAVLVDALVPGAVRMVEIARDGAPTDARGAIAWIYDRTAGPVAQKHELTGKDGAPLCTPTMLEVIVVGSATIAAKPAAEESAT